jgi:CheY-like chemotaxis protein
MNSGVEISGTTVLLVEDEPVVQTVIERHLLARGCSVYVAGDVDAALDVMAEHGADVNFLIIDSVLPSRSGSNISTELKSLFGTERTLVISGYPQPVNSPYAFLQKPFTGERLVQEIERLMSISTRPRD